jgi:hypothetical protein
MFLRVGFGRNVVGIRLGAPAVQKRKNGTRQVSK